MSTSEKQTRTGLGRLHSCENCRLRAYAERKPDALISRIWHWHSGWCPLFKAYRKKRAEEQQAQPTE